MGNVHSVIFRGLSWKHPGTQYLFLLSFGLAAWLGEPHDSVQRSLDTIQKRALAQGPSRSRVTAQ